MKKKIQEKEQKRSKYDNQDAETGRQCLELAIVDDVDLDRYDRVTSIGYIYFELNQISDCIITDLLNDRL